MSQIELFSAIVRIAKKAHRSLRPSLGSFILTSSTYLLTIHDSRYLGLFILIYNTFQLSLFSVIPRLSIPISALLIPTSPSSVPTTRISRITHLINRLITPCYTRLGPIGVRVHSLYISFAPCIQMSQLTGAACDSGIPIPLPPMGIIPIAKFPWPIIPCCGYPIPPIPIPPMPFMPPIPIPIGPI